MSPSALSISPGARITTDLFGDQTAAPAVTGAFVTSLLPAACILLMCFLQNPWLAASAFIPAYGVFWLSVRSAVRQGRGRRS